jgi:hypothetical protein
MEVSEEFLESAFEHVGKILDVIVKRHLICTEPSHISGYGFVFFEDMNAAARAISTMKGVVVDGVQFDCQYGTPKREDRKHQHHGPSFGLVSPQVLQQIHAQQSSHQHQHPKPHFHPQQPLPSQQPHATNAAFHMLQQQQQQTNLSQNAHHSSAYHPPGTHNHHGGMNHAPSPLTLSATSSGSVMSSRSGGASLSSSPVVSYLQPTQSASLPGTPTAPTPHRSQQVPQPPIQSFNGGNINNFHNNHLSFNGNGNGIGCNSNRSNQPLQQALFNQAQISGNLFADADIRMNTVHSAPSNPNFVRSAVNDNAMSRPAHTLLPVHHQRHASEPHNHNHGNFKSSRNFEMEKEFAAIQLASQQNPAGNHSNGSVFAGIRDLRERNPSLDLSAYQILPPPAVAATAASAQTTTASSASASSVHLQVQISDRMSRSEDWLSEAMSPSAQDALLPPSFSSRAVHPIHPSASIDDRSSSLSNHDDHAIALAARGLLATATYSRDDFHGELSSMSSSSMSLPPGQPYPSSASGRHSLGGLSIPSVCTTVADNSLLSPLSYGPSRSFSSSFDKWHASPLASSSTVGSSSIARSNAYFFGNSGATNSSRQRDRASFVSPEPWTKDFDGFGLSMNASYEEILGGDAKARKLESLGPVEPSATNHAATSSANNSKFVVSNNTMAEGSSSFHGDAENGAAQAPPGLVAMPSAIAHQSQLQEHYLAPQMITSTSQAQAGGGEFR